MMKLFEAAGNVASQKTQDKVFALADACFCDARGRGATHADKEYPQGKILLDAFEAVVNTDSKAVSSAMLEKGKSGKEIGEAIRVARIDAIRNVLKERP